MLASYLVHNKFAIDYAVAAGPSCSAASDSGSGLTAQQVHKTGKPLLEKG